MHRQENGSEIWNVEPCCFEQNHIDCVKQKIMSGFERESNDTLETIFDEYVADRLGDVMTKLGCHVSPNKIADRVAESAIESYSNEFQVYNDLFNKESMEEASFDPVTFKKTTLRNKCPIIRQTLNSKEKGLRKFIIKFNDASADELYEKINNIVDFGLDYQQNLETSAYELITNYRDMGLESLDQDEYAVSGVIGGGIKSLILYMRNPQWFPNRSRNAIWALYFLTDKDPMGCKMESEFIMVNVREFLVSQNYFYPYALFSYYALVIYNLLKNRFEDLGVALNPKYRYAYVDSFLEFIAKKYNTEIYELQRKLTEDYV